MKKIFGKYVKVHEDTHFIKLEAIPSATPSAIISLKSYTLVMIAVSVLDADALITDIPANTIMKIKKSPSDSAFLMVVSSNAFFRLS